MLSRNENEVSAGLTQRSSTALDLDGVIFDYEKTFQKEAYGIGFEVSVKHPEIYNMSERYEIPQEQVFLINSRIDFSDIDTFDEVQNLKRYIEKLNIGI